MQRGNEYRIHNKKLHNDEWNEKKKQRPNESKPVSGVIDAHESRVKNSTDTRRFHLMNQYINILEENS